MDSGVYKILNIITGDYYIGSSKSLKNRWRNHKWHLNKKSHHNNYLQNAWNKYGDASFVFQILEMCDDKKEVLLAREQYFIDALKPQYNILDKAGSRLGYKLSPEAVEQMRKRASNISDETRKKMSDAAKGRKLSEDHKSKISSSLKGRTFDDDSRRKMSEAAKKRNKNRDINGELNPFYGKRHSEETKQKISKNRSGKKHTIITKQKISESITKWHQERKSKNGDASSS